MATTTTIPSYVDCEEFGARGSQLGAGVASVVGSAYVFPDGQNKWIVKSKGKPPVRVIGFCWQAYGIACALGGAQ